MKDASVTMGKKWAIAVLAAISTAIVLLGVAYITFSVKAGVSLKILNASVPGYIFGGMAVFLGIRYFITLLKLWKVIRSPELKFNWKNIIRRT